VKRDLEELLRHAEAAGCVLQRSKRGGHVKVFVPGGPMIIVSKSPSDWRGVLNARAAFRRAGLDI
jgi:hypothetical protein